MKLIRHLGLAGPVWAALQPDGTARAINGDVPGEFDPDRHPRPAAGFGDAAEHFRHRLELSHARSRAVLPVLERPMAFMKGTNTVQDPDGPIDLPRALPCDEVDYEGELTVVIGRPGRNIPRAHALEHVLGYTMANDISSRNRQVKLGGGQFCHGKSIDTFYPLGPVLVTCGEVLDPGRLRIRTVVNGKLFQDGARTT